jgi:hypothetical protein
MKRFLDGVQQPRWVQTTEIRPLNPRVTHHARLGIDSSNESTRRDAEDDEPGYAGMAGGKRSGWTTSCLGTGSAWVRRVSRRRVAVAERPDGSRES